MLPLHELVLPLGRRSCCGEVAPRGSLCVCRRPVPASRKPLNLPLLRGLSASFSASLKRACLFFLFCKIAGRCNIRSIRCVLPPTGPSDALAFLAGILHSHAVFVASVAPPRLVLPAPVVCSGRRAAPFLSRARSCLTISASRFAVLLHNSRLAFVDGSQGVPAPRHNRASHAYCHRSGACWCRRKICIRSPQSSAPV